MASGSLRLLVVGNTSSGKTTTGNSILGKENVLSEDSFSRVTSGYQSAERSGTVVEVIELPSLDGTKMSEEDIAVNVIQAVAGMHPGPTAILYVIAIRRYTEEDDSLYKRLKRLFDDRITEYIIIIFTSGGLLKQGNKKIEDLFKMAPESLRMALQECGHRYVVFDNMADDKQPQVDRLLQEVHKLSETHSGQPYTCPKYSYIGEKIEKELERRLLIVKEEFMRKKYVKDLEENARKTIKKLEKEKSDYEKNKDERDRMIRNVEAERINKVVELQEMINKEEYMATLLQEKEKKIRQKMKQEREEFRRYMETYKEIELEEAGKQIQGTEIPLEEKKGSKEELKDQKKIVANPSFPVSIGLKGDLCDTNDNDKDVQEPSCTLPLSSLSLWDTDTTEVWQNSFNFDPSSSKPLRFFLMGKTGGGKSATGNTILGEPLFDTDLCCSSVVSSCFLKSRTRNGISIEITDSPGLCDTKTPEEDTAGKVVQAVACMHPGPTAFLYVIGIGRYTEEDHGVYKRIKSLFDDRVTGYIIIIFTRGDQLKQHNKTMEDALHTAPDSLLMALGECGDRHVVFDNMADNKQQQVNCLLQIVRKMSEKNGWEPYTCPKYKEVGEQMNQEVARRLKKVQKEEMKRKKYVQELEEKTKLAEQKAEQEKIAFEKKEAEREEMMKKAKEEREKKMEALQKMIIEQKLSAEKQMEEEKKLRQEKEQMMEKLEKERKEEQMRIEKLMKENAQLLINKEAALKEEREARRKFIEAKEKEELKLKSEVAEQSGSCIIL